MKKLLPENFPELNYHKLPYLAVQWETLKTALVLGVFNHLNERQSACDIARLIAGDQKNTEYMLNALTAMGYLFKKDGYFYNNEQTERFLTNRGETSLVEYLLTCDQWNEPVLHGQMLKLVKEGAPTARNKLSDKLWADFARKAIHSARCGRAQKIALLLSGFPDFNQWQKVLDLGAGPGLTGIALAISHPALQCYLFDRPAVIGVTREVIKEYDMEDRLKTISGDYFTDPIGESYDAVIASYTFNSSWGMHQLTLILKKCFAALNPGGCLVIFSDGLGEEKTKPAATVIAGLSTALTGQGSSFEEDVLPRTMLNAGFASVRTKTLTDQVLAPHGPTEFHLGRKC